MGMNWEATGFVSSTGAVAAGRDTLVRRGRRTRPVAERLRFPAGPDGGCKT
jgi:hypothetical protein